MRKNWLRPSFRQAEGNGSRQQKRRIRLGFGMERTERRDDDQSESSASLWSRYSSSSPRPPTWPAYIDSTPNRDQSPFQHSESKNDGVFNDSSIQSSPVPARVSSGSWRREDLRSVAAQFSLKKWQQQQQQQKKFLHRIFFSMSTREYSAVHQTAYILEAQVNSGST